METLLLIDGNAIMHRAYHAIPPFKTVNGVSTNMIYGFLSMLYKCITDFKPQYIAVCFDTPKPTFRNQLYSEYQSQRPKAENDFIIQVPLVLEMLEKAGIAKFAKEGFEADDVIGTLASRYASNKLQVLILTGDKDIMQLVNHYVFVISPQTGLSSVTLYDENKVITKLGIKPSLIPDLKALMGDPSDNYPGAKGIGPKTAVKLLTQFGDVTNMLQNINEIKEERIKKLIQENINNITLSHELATIRRDVPLEVDLQSLRFVEFKQELYNFLKGLQINSLRERIFNKVDIPEAKPKKNEEKKKNSNEDQIDLFS